MQGCISIMHTQMYARTHTHMHTRTHTCMHTHIAGPFLISTTINKEPVYWKVDQDTVIGTKIVPNASLFYFMSFEDNVFTIAYWGDKLKDRKLLTNVTDDLSELRTIAPRLPLFVSTSNSTLGHSHGPLLLKTTFPLKKVTFTLYSRMQSSFACLTCVSNPEDILTWMEGEQFFLKHKTFLKEEFVVIKEDPQSGVYTTSMQSSAKDVDNPLVGMLFRLHPHKFQTTSLQSSSSGHAADTPQGSEPSN